VGLYLAPPANAVVFSVDEKPQIQALQPTAPVLPMLPGAPERRSFDYTRHGTVDLFAALDAATGKLSAQHRAFDWAWCTAASAARSRLRASLAFTRGARPPTNRAADALRWRTMTLAIRTCPALGRSGSHDGSLLSSRADSACG